MAGLKSYFPSSLYAPTATMAAFKAQTAPAAPSAPSGSVHPASAGFTAHSQKEYGLDYFLKGALAGGICCSVTHGALTPVDVVKTRMQLDPTKYTGMVSGFQKVVAEEGAGALLTGLGPTAFGYFIQGWFKFGGVEFFKIQAAKSLTPQETWDNRNSIYLGSSAAAEFIADIFLCPLEATRIRLVSNPSYADSMLGAMGKMASEEGIIGAFYSGFGPILAKQVPYTMAKFAVLLYTQPPRRSTTPSARPPRRCPPARTSPCPSRPASSRASSRPSSPTPRIPSCRRSTRLAPAGPAACSPASRTSPPRRVSSSCARRGSARGA